MKLMPVIPQFHGKKVSVVLAQGGGTSPRRCEVIVGTAHWRAGRWWLDRSPAPEIPIPKELLSRVRRVAPELRGILGEPELCIVWPAGCLEESEAPSAPERAAACARRGRTLFSPSRDKKVLVTLPTTRSREHPTDKLLRMV